MDGNDNMLIVGLNDEDFLLGLFGAREKKKWGVRDQCVKFCGEKRKPRKSWESYLELWIEAEEGRESEGESESESGV